MDKTLKIKRYSPYGINGEYFIYDNKNHCLKSMEYPKTKKKAIARCEELNNVKK
jgi:hypothetical protein